jgi:hypothetical protein
VDSLVVYNGDLIAGGVFTSAGGQIANNIARWNGSYWQPLGSGLGGPDAQAAALIVYDDELITTGTITLAGGNPASRIARWRDCHMCLSDINNDNEVGIDDLVSVITAWGPCPPQPLWCGADVAPAVTGDGVVDINDLVAIVQGWGSHGIGYGIDDLVNVVTNWGPCPATPPAPVCQQDIAPATTGGSGAVDIDDLVSVITSWGPCR